jgi:hypothetical protein
LMGHSLGSAVCLEAARIMHGAAGHVIGLDALLFPELFGPRTARKSAPARVLLRTPLAARAINSWVERFFVAPYDPAVPERVVAAITPFDYGGHYFFMEYLAETATAIQRADGALATLSYPDSEHRAELARCVLVSISFRPAPQSHLGTGFQLVTLSRSAWSLPFRDGAGIASASAETRIRPSWRLLQRRW